MIGDLSQSETQAAQETWQQIDRLVEEIAELSRSGCPDREFYEQSLNRLLHAVAGFGGAIWKYHGPAQVDLRCQVNLAAAGIAEDPGAQRQHGQLLDAVLTTGESRIVPPQAGALVEGLPQNPTDFLLLLVPLKAEGGCTGVIEVFQRPGASPAVQQGYLGLLETVGEIVADYERYEELRALRSRNVLWGRFERFTQQIHSDLDLKRTGYAIANEGRNLIECDRVSVIISHGTACRLLAVSGVESFDRRANLVRHLQQLAAAVVTGGSPLWYPADADQLAPQIADPLREYLEESPAQVLAVVPLRPNPGSEEGELPPSIGALVVERFAGVADDDFYRRVLSAAEHSGLAIENAQEYEATPFLSVLAPLRRIRRSLKRSGITRLIAGIGLAVAIVLGLVVVPADFSVEAPGELLPSVQRDIFAPNDGVVSELPVAGKNRIRTGDVLAVLRQPKLDLEFRRLLGEMQTATKRLSAVQAVRVDNRRSTADSAEDYRRLTAEEEELKALLQSLEQQHQILVDQQAELTVRSPVDGEVITWNIERLLDARPVSRGQILMTVADPAGPWMLELQIPDDEMGHVLDAQAEFGDNLEVSFVLASQPGLVHRERLDSVSAATDLTPDDLPMVLAHVNLDRVPIGRPKSGMTVNARIHCGRRSIGYVWLHDLLEAIQSHILF